jgi:MFS family permease
LTAPSFRATVAALAIGQLLCWAALYYAFSSFVLPMQRELGWSAPHLMGAFTLGLAVSGLATYAAGAAIDRGHGRWVLSAGPVLGGLGFFVWAHAASLATLYAAWVLIGAAMSMCMYDPAFSVLTKRYPNRFGQGITALTLVGGFASTLAFPAAVWLIGCCAWRGALQVIGAVLVLGVAPLHAWALRGAPDPSSVSQSSAVEPDTTLHEALGDPRFWLLTASFALYAFAAAATWAHIMPAFAAKGLSDTETVAIVVWFGPAQVAGRVIYLAFGRGLSTRALGLFVLGGIPLSLAVFAGSNRVLGFTLFALLFGFANGLVTIVRGTIVPQTFGHAHVGRISGAMNAISLLARAAAPVASAGLLLVVAGYRELLFMLAGLGVAALIAFALVRPRR